MSYQLRVMSCAKVGINYELAKKERGIELFLVNSSSSFNQNSVLNYFIEVGFEHPNGFLLFGYKVAH